MEINKVLDDICKTHGLKIHHPEIEFKEHMKIQKFRAVMELKNLYQEIGQAKELIDKSRGNIEELKLTASIENDNLEEIKERVEERMQDVTYEVTLSRKEYNDLLKSAMAYESVLDTYADRGERMIEMHEALSNYKHSLEKMEKAVEKLEEYEDVLSNIHDEHGVSALEAFEKQKKKEEKDKKKSKQGPMDKDDAAVRQISRYHIATANKKCPCGPKTIGIFYCGKK